MLRGNDNKQTRLAFVGVSIRPSMSDQATQPGFKQKGAFATHPDAYDGSGPYVGPQERFRGNAFG